MYFYCTWLKNSVSSNVAIAEISLAYIKTLKKEMMRENFKWRINLETFKLW